MGMLALHRCFYGLSLIKYSKQTFANVHRTNSIMGEKTEITNNILFVQKSDYSIKIVGAILVLAQLWW